MKKTVLLFALAVILVITALPVFADKGSVELPGQKAVFTDISGHWAKAVIEKMGEKGIVSGVEENKFMPNASMKRSQFAALLHRVLGINIAYFVAPDITKTFDDVKNEDWYASNLINLVTVGIVDDKFHFRPNDDITREEIVHYIMNAYRYKLNTDAAEAKNLFSDNSLITPEYRSDVYKAVGLGLIFGKGNNRFDPRGKSTRAEALVIIDRFLETVNKELSRLVKIEPGCAVKDNKFVMTLSITNNSDAAVTFRHGSGQKYDFVLLDSNGDELYRWSKGKFFTMALTSTTVAPGETVTFTESLDLEANKDIIDKAASMKAYIAGQSDDFTINPEGYEIKVQK